MQEQEPTFFTHLLWKNVGFFFHISEKAGYYGFFRTTLFSHRNHANPELLQSF